MGYFRQNRHRIAWLACIAILLNALMPTISHAMASSQDQSGFWTSVCSASGTKFIPAPFSKPTDKNSDSKPMSMVHCPYCLAHAGSVALLPATTLLLAPASLSYALPRLFYLSPSPLFAWASANPRAPPTLT
jgi:hypothetical protein